MSNKGKDIIIKNHTYYFFDDTINIKNVDANNIKIHKNSCKKSSFVTLVYIDKKIERCKI